jgi:hypothetical protein
VRGLKYARNKQAAACIPPLLPNISIVRPVKNAINMYRDLFAVNGNTKRNNTYGYGLM